MRLARQALCCAIALLSTAGCSFRVGAVDYDAAPGVDGGDQDLAAGDLAELDLTGADLLPPDLLGSDLSGADLASADMVAPADMVMAADMVVPPDMVVPADMVVPPDMVIAPDMITPPDMLVVVFPSHVATHYLNDSVTNWTITSDTTIDTTQNTLALAVSPPAPAGVQYTIDNGLAVIAVGSLTLGSDATSTTRLRVRGNRPLVIVAGSNITINGLLDAGGQGNQPGASGANSSGGNGAGTDGTGGGGNGTGGSGAGHESTGGDGGGALKGNGNTTGGPSGGGTYGAATLPMLLGGSGGGDGSAQTGASLCGAPRASGGGGGGAVQLSARGTITLVASHGGGFPLRVGGIINVGGGAGQGGCPAGTRSGSGAGGGSGGSLLVEAPAINAAGVLGASGGGAGAGATHFQGGGDGHDALDYGDPTTSSQGGTKAFLTGAGDGGKGANLVVNIGDSAPGGNSTNVDHSGGGGGGGYGRIYLRSNGAPTLGAAQQSPFPVVDTSLPATIP